MIFKKFIYSNKKFVWLLTCESWEAIGAEKTWQVVYKKSHEAVYKLFTSFTEWQQVHKEIRKKMQISCVIFYVFK